MKTLVILTAVVFNLTATAQPEKRIDSRIGEVTVFLNRAQVNRSTTARIDAGRSTLVIAGLTSRLDPQSIQVSGTGRFTILGVTHRQNYLTEFTLPPRMRILKDSLQLLKDQIQQTQANKEIANKEEQLILSNQKIGGANQNLSVQELKAMADFFRTRLTEIAEQKARYDKRITILNESLVKVQRQFQEQNDLMLRNTSEVVVSVDADAATNVQLELTYVVANAGWNPLYDIRGESTNRPLKLQYKANVYQSTGEDWNNVRLTLSTGNPALGGVKPDLLPWYLDFYRPVVRSPVYLEKAKREAPAAAQAADEELVDIKLDAGSVAQSVTIQQSSLSTRFSIGLPYTVASGGNPTVVDIATHSVDASYRYAAAPKLDGDAFLMARATAWEALNLLPGEANVFMEGAFVGKTFINPQQITDTLSISMGRDKRIVVKREKVKDFTSRRFVGSNTRETSGFEISIRNTRNEPVTIMLEDQIPISQNNQIEVSLLDNGNARYDAVTGKLSWELTLKPQEQRKVVYKFEVKYPKDKTISGL